MAVRLTGRIVGIRVERQDVFFTLDNDPKVGPKGNAFILRGDHGNLNQIYSLALAAAANRWPVTIRIGGDGQIAATLEATVRSLGVNWGLGGADPD